MSTSLRNSLLVLIKVIISASLLTWLVSRADLSQIWLTIKNADWFLLTIAFLIFYVGFTCASKRWQLLLRAIKIPARLWDLFLTFSAAVFFNNFLPSTVGGDAYRAYSTYQLGTGKGQAVAVVMIDRIIGLSALLLVALFASIAAPQVATHIPLIHLFLLVAVAGMAILAWVIFGHGADALLRWFSGANPVFKLVHKVLSKLSSSFNLYTKRHDVLFQAIGLSLMLQVVVVIHSILIARALNIDISISALFIIVPLSFLIMTAPISINGIGLRESIFVFFFGLYGVSEEQALAFSFTSFAMILGQGIIGGLIFMLRRRRARIETSPTP